MKEKSTWTSLVQENSNYKGGEEWMGVVNL